MFLWALPAIAFLGTWCAWAQPVLRTTDPVVNGASYANSIAPGSIFVVFGTNLAGDAILQAPSLPLQTALGGVSIRFTPAAGGAPIDALMVYTTKNQIAGLLPSSTAAGTYNVTVTYNSQTSAPGVAEVTARSVGIVTADSSGAGQAQAQIYYSATKWSLNRFATTKLGSFDTAVAHPGEVMVLWLTGLGADASSDLNGGTAGDRTQRPQSASCWEAKSMCLLFPAGHPACPVLTRSISPYPRTLRPVARFPFR